MISMKPDDLKLKGFVKFIRPPKGGRKSPLSRLEIDEIWFFPESYGTKIYQRAYGMQRRTGKKFAYKEIKNGILVKRIK